MSTTEITHIQGATRINIIGTKIDKSDPLMSELAEQLRRVTEELENVKNENFEIKEQLKNERSISAKQVHELRKLRDQLSDSKAQQRALQYEADIKEGRPPSSAGRPGSSRSLARPGSSHGESFLTEVRTASVSSKGTNTEKRGDAERELKQEVELLEGKLADAKEKVDKLIAEINNERERARNAERSLKESQDKVSKLEARIIVGDGKVAELEEAAGKFTEIKLKLEEELRRSKVQLGASQDTLGNQDKQVDDLKEKIKKLDKDMGLKNKHIQELQSEMNNLRSRQATSAASDTYEAVLAEELRTMRDSFQKQIDTLTADLERQTRDHAHELRRKEEAIQTERKSFETKMDLQRRKLALAEEKLSKLEAGAAAT